MDTRSLLRYGLVAGPFYLILGIGQGLMREGFDFSKHALSHLANGPGGWVQTLNFVLTGAMVIAAAVGIARVIRPRRATSIFLACFGISMIAAAFFPADPIDGFPPGTPSGAPTAISTTGIVHFAAGGLGFIALAVSAFLMARVMSKRGAPSMALMSLFAGLSIIGGFFAPMFGLPSPVLGIWFAVVVGWAWLAIISMHLSRTSGPDDGRQ